MSGESGAVAGATMRATDAAVAPARSTVPAGSPSADRRPPTTVPAERIAMPRLRRRSWSIASQNRPTWPRTAASGAPGMSSSSPVARSSSNITRAICTAPTPSVMAWWTLRISAAWSPSRPSATVISQSGRARSKPCIAMGSARSSTDRTLRSPPARTKRRWKSRSKLGSTSQRGGAIESGFERTRCRMRGTRRVPRSTRSRRRTRSGAWSSTATAVMVDRSIGSFSIDHISASESLMRCSKRMSPIVRPPVLPV